jgi:hypothetical protein
MSFLKLIKTDPKFRVEVAAVVVGAAVLLVYICQLRAMRESVDNTAKQFQVDARPFVSITKIDLLGHLNEGEQIKGRAEIVNSGRTPAVNLRGCSDIALLPNSSPMTDEFPCPAPNNPKRKESEISIFSMGSGAPFPMESPGTTINPIASLLPLLKSGSVRLYYYGEVTYGDVLKTGNAHHTSFCVRYNVDTGLPEICEKHNRMD